MDYFDLAYERMDSWEKTRTEINRLNEARRLGLTGNGWSPIAKLDGLLIRVSKNASRRQARRECRSARQRELVS